MIQLSFCSLLSEEMERLSVKIALVYVGGTYIYTAMTLVWRNGVCFQTIGNEGFLSCLQGSKGYQGLPGVSGKKGLPVSSSINLDQLQSCC